MGNLLVDNAIAQKVPIPIGWIEDLCMLVGAMATLMNVQSECRISLTQENIARRTVAENELRQRVTEPDKVRGLLDICEATSFCKYGYAKKLVYNNPYSLSSRYFTDTLIVYINKHHTRFPNMNT
jgi:hypothetical protein